MRLGKRQIETLKLAHNGQVLSFYAERFTNNKRKYFGASEKVIVSLINKNLLQEHHIDGAFSEIRYVPTELAKNFLQNTKTKELEMESYIERIHEMGMIEDENRRENAICRFVDRLDMHYANQDITTEQYNIICKELSKI